MRVLRASLAAFLLVLGVVPAALAQGPLEILTAYPAVVADPGATVTFPSTVLTDTSERVDLSVDQPARWMDRSSARLWLDDRRGDHHDECRHGPHQRRFLGRGGRPGERVTG